MNELQKLIIWLSYNTGRNTELRHNSKALVNQFKVAISGKSKICDCSNTPKTVNEFWDDWHCTYCLKPKRK